MEQNSHALIGSKPVSRTTRRIWLQTSCSLAGLSLPAFLSLRQQSATASGNMPQATRRCIVVYCWGGMSHHETWDPKPEAPSNIRGEFHPISTSTPGLFIGEHMPLLAQQTEKLAIIRSMHHTESAHGRGMYWNMTGHPPPASRPGNIAPESGDWPSLPAMVSYFHPAPKGVPRAVRLPYPLVDNGTLQAGEYGGWMGVKYDPIVLRTPAGEEFGGVSRTLGSEALNLNEGLPTVRQSARRDLMCALERTIGQQTDFSGFSHFRELAGEMLLSSAVKNAYDLGREDSRVRERYGNHIGGQSLLLARRLTEAGVPIVQVCCAAGDLNGGQGDMWDTHGDNFNRLKNRLLPVYDRGVSALLTDLDERGTLDETLVVLLTEFGRTPTINGSAGRDHYPNVYSVVLAGGGVRGGQLYGSSTPHRSRAAHTTMRTKRPPRDHLPRTRHFTPGCPA